MPIQLDFNLRRLVEMADADARLRDQQPWEAACERDGAWLSGVITDHYAGDDRKLKTMMAGVLAEYDSSAPIDRWSSSSTTWWPSGPHLHRLRRGPRLHAAGQQRALRRPA
jgi:hypothetical protein